jgi:SAM-dependent methyltransferase
MSNSASSAARFVHPRARLDDGEHELGLDAASEASINYLNWIAEVCRPHIGRRFLDLGAGHGVITQHLASGRDVVALDRSESCVDAMNERFQDWPNVTVVKGDLRDLDLSERFDSIVMFNVLEHILDDGGVLATCATYLEPGGNILLYVPALNGLYTEWDRKVGHHRRYSKRRLASVVEEAGLEVAELRYMNLLAIPAWLVSGRLTANGDTCHSRLALWDKTGTVLGRAIERRVRVPIGLNLFCVARRPTVATDH